MERNWDEDFYRLFGGEVPLEKAGSEGPFTASEKDVEEYYMGLLQRREEMMYVQHEVMVNAFQSKTFLFGTTGLAVMCAMALSVAWSVWYWCR